MNENTIRYSILYSEALSEVQERIKLVRGSAGACEACGVAAGRLAAAIL